MKHQTHDHYLLSTYEHRKPPLTSQPQHQPHGPTCLIILSIWLETGGLCVCLRVFRVCVLSVLSVFIVLSVLSVCVLCVCVSVLCVCVSVCV